MRLRMRYKFIQAGQRGYHTLSAPGTASDPFAPGHAWVDFMTQVIETKERKALEENLFGVVTTRWIELDQDIDVWEQSDVGVCTDRVRQIGEQLNRLGGNSILAAARYNVAQRCGLYSPDLEAVFNTEINWVWNGIGGWQA